MSKHTKPPHFAVGDTLAIEMARLVPFMGDDQLHTPVEFEEYTAPALVVGTYFQGDLAEVRLPDGAKRTVNRLQRGWRHVDVAEYETLTKEYRIKFMGGKE